MGFGRLVPAGAVIAWLATVSPAAAGPREAVALTMAANASGRPRECAAPSHSSERAWRPTLWDNARQPQLKRYCDLIGRAQSRLGKAPVAAREVAIVADRIMPGYAAPWVIVARADVALGRFDDALKSFERARGLEPRAAEEPHALHDLALAQRHAGKLDDSHATYRSLVPRLALLPAVQERAVILLETAALAMARSEEGTREAISLLTEARGYPASAMDPDVYALLALALDRAGARAQAAEVLELMHARGLELTAPSAESQGFGYLVRAGDAHAMYALASERADPKKAADSWERFIAKESLPRWREHATKHLESARAAASRKPRAAAPGVRAPGTKR